MPPPPELSAIEQRLYVERHAQPLIDTCTIAGGKLRLRFLCEPGAAFSVVLDFDRAELDDARGASSTLHEVADGTVFPPHVLPKAPLPWHVIRFTSDAIPNSGRARFVLQCREAEFGWESDWPILE